MGNDLIIAQPIVRNPPMPSDEISAILQALERFSGKYEQEAVDAAIAHREEITPHLIVSLEKVAADPSVYLEDEGYYLYIYAVMLLGHFQETRAHQAIVEVFGLPGDIPDKLFGDITTGNLPIILFNTCGGQFDLIKSLILNLRAEGYVRGSAAQALAYGVAAGQLPREEVLTFFSTLFTGDEAELSSPFWSLIADCILDLQPLELMPLIKEADERGLLDYGLLFSEGDFDRALGKSIDQSLESVRREMQRDSLDDLEKVMARWAGFGDEKWGPFIIPTDATKTKSKKVRMKKKKKMAKTSRRKNRR
jgi:hypothetical protein